MNEPRDQRDVERLEELARFPDENPNPVLRVSPEGSVLYANEAARQTRGLLAGRKREKLAKDLFQNLAAAVADETVHNVEFEASGATYNLALVPVVGQRYVNVFGSNVTESKRTEKALTDQLEFTKALMDALPNPTFVKDTEARYVSFNRAWEEAFGVKREEFIGKTVMDLDRLPLEMRNDYFKEDMELLQTGGDRHSETVRTFADGKEHDMLYWQASIEPAEGVIAGLVGMHVDISEQKQMEKSVRESEELLATILNNSPIPIALRDSEGKFLLINRGYEELHGISRDDVVGKTLHEFLPKEAADEISRQDSETLATREPTVSEERYQLDDGERILSVVMFPTFDLSGKATGVGIFDVDITQAKRNEEELARREFEARLILRITDMTTNTKSRGEALEQALTTICETLGWPVGHVYRVEDDGQQLVTTGFWHLDDVERYATFKGVTESTNFAKGEGLPGRIWESGEPAWITNVQTDPNFPRAKHAVDIGVKGAFGFPVKISGKTVAVLEFFSDEELSPDESLLTIMGKVGVEIGRVFRRRDAELQLQEKEAQLRVALENIPGGLVYTDEALNVVICNDRFADIYQAPRELLEPGKPYPGFLRYMAEHGYYGEGDVDELVAQRVEDLRNPADKPFEYHMPDGGVHEIRRRAAMGGTVTVVTDVTERKQAEQELAESQEHLQALADYMHVALSSMSDGIYILDGELNIVAFNQRYVDLLNFPEGLVREGRSIVDVTEFAAKRGDYGSQFGDDVEDIVAARLEQLKRNEEYVIENITPTGRLVEYRGSPIEGGGFVSIMHDITERKQAEQELAETQTQMRMALETLPGGLVYTDADLNVVVSNDKFAEMHNVPKELLESGRPYTDFLKFLAEHGYYGEGDVDAFVAQRVEVIRNPTEATLDHQTPEGRIHEIRRRKVSGGGTVTVVTDVTEEKQAAEKISRQAQMLMEMSTPVTQMWPGTLLLPLVGMIDNRRAHDILNAVLEKISATRAKVLILDISGVSVVDSAVANHLIQITKATKLMGCHCVISGVSSAVAQTIVELGIDVEDVETTANLAQAIREREFSLA